MTKQKVINVCLLWALLCSSSDVVDTYNHYQHGWQKHSLMQAMHIILITYWIHHYYIVMGFCDAQTWDMWI